ncbi:MAG: glycosyltransferase family 4 protein [Bacteroidales bacterium]|nr:glycosyltransferase family 4 protein [Bacteroidales bacterium]
MKILFIIPGSGDAFYCGNCFRDYLYVKALQHVGHEVTVMPLYLPLTDKSFNANTPLFFPATSYYVAQKFFPKGKMPRFLEKILSFPSILRLASSFSGTTSAKGMEQMTLSMIKGDDPNFSKEAKKLINWILQQTHPDVIHLSSSLLIGIAKAIKSQLNIPIVCSLQDEGIWIDNLEPHYAKLAWTSIHNNAHHIDRFVTTSEWYKRKIAAVADIVYPGIPTHNYYAPDYPQDPTIGFFYRMNQLNGLDILCKAFVQLKRENRVKNLRLRIGGGYSSTDKKFLKTLRKMVKPYKEFVEWCDHYRLEEHAKFYAQISAICVPITFEESVGLYVCEAFAAGRPAIAPDTGSFSEIVSNGGVLYHPNTPEALAEAIDGLFTDEGCYARCCEGAVRFSSERYEGERVGGRLAVVYSLPIDTKNSSLLSVRSSRVRINSMDSTEFMSAK